MLLDGPLHLEKASRFRSAHRFLVRRLTRMVEDIEQTTVTSGARIWKVYNHGFVVRTPSLTVGMDICPGWRSGQGYRIPTQLCSRLLAQVDVLAMSHEHGDHADPGIRDLAFQAKIPVLADASIFPDIRDNPLLIRPVRLDPQAASDPAGRPSFTTVTVCGSRRVGVLAYPGHQGPAVLNDVFVLHTPDGLTFMHTGDQAYAEDFAWLDRVGDRHGVDILFANCWTPDLDRMLAGVRPRLLVTGHENEMSHAPDHREAFWRSFQLLRAQPAPPACILCWGEGFDYPIRQ